MSEPFKYHHLQQKIKEGVGWRQSWKVTRKSTRVRFVMQIEVKPSPLIKVSRHLKPSFFVWYRERDMLTNGDFL